MLLPSHSAIKVIFLAPRVRAISSTQRFPRSQGALDLGSSWAAFSSGLPNAMAVDLLFHKQDRRLFYGTRNRGAWVVLVP